MAKLRALSFVSVIFCTAASLSATALTYIDGTSAGFTDSSTAARVATWNTDTSGNAAPFNGFIGSDVSSNFTAVWTFNYGVISDMITGATLQLGIFDLDSAASLDAVASYTEGSHDLTGLLNTASNARHGGTGTLNNEYDLLTITLPSATFADLASGTVNISLSLQGPGLGTLGNTNFNGAGIDISTLTITTQTSGGGGSVPEPGTVLLAGGCLAVLMLGRRHLQLT